MKKSLIALAALAAVGAASAQSSVTLYGVIDTGYSWTRATVGGDKTTTTGLTSGNLSSSRWGLKGQEDLGNGLAAVFNVEAGFDSSNGRTGGGFDFSNINSGIPGVYGNGFNRRAVVGLKGSFGQVLLGTDYTPMDIVADGNGFQAIQPDVTNGFYTARAKGIHYSGNFNGFGVSAFAGHDQVKYNDTVISKQQGYGVGLGYANGPFAIQGAVQHFKDSFVDSILGSNKEQTEYGLGATYDFTAAKLYGHYLVVDPKASKARQQVAVGVTVPFGAVTVGAQYAYNFGKASAYGFGGDENNVKGHNFGLQATYALSKRTDLYALAQRVAAVKVSASDINDKTDKVAVGIRHRF